MLSSEGVDTRGTTCSNQIISLSITVSFLFISLIIVCTVQAELRGVFSVSAKTPEVAPVFNSAKVAQGPEQTPKGRMEQKGFCHFQQLPNQFICSMKEKPRLTSSREFVKLHRPLNESRLQCPCTGYRGQERQNQALYIWVVVPKKGRVFARPNTTTPNPCPFPPLFQSLSP